MLVDSFVGYLTMLCQIRSYLASNEVRISCKTKRKGRDLSSNSPGSNEEKNTKNLRPIDTQPRLEPGTTGTLAMTNFSG